MNQYESVSQVLECAAPYYGTSVEELLQEINRSIEIGMRNPDSTIQRKWGMKPAECTELFQRFDIFPFIAECYDTLHLASYDCALRDVEEILQSHGVKVC